MPIRYHIPCSRMYLHVEVISPEGISLKGKWISSCFEHEPQLSTVYIASALGLGKATVVRPPEVSNKAGTD